MKPSFNSAALLLFLIFLISSSSSLSARLTIQQDKQSAGQNMKLIKVRGETTVSELESSDSFTKLMGMVDCNSGDEECFKRRMTMEAHLDYIYTQHHKP